MCVCAHVHVCVYENMIVGIYMQTIIIEPPTFHIMQITIIMDTVLTNTDAIIIIVSVFVSTVSVITIAYNWLNIHSQLYLLRILVQTGQH